MPGLHLACHRDSLRRADLIVKHRLTALRATHEQTKLFRDWYKELLRDEIHGIAMQALLKAAETYDGKCAFSHWLWVQVKGQLRTTIRQVFRQMGGRPDNEGKPKSELTATYTAESFLKMIDKRSTNGVPGHDFAKMTQMLSPRKREMLELRFIQDMSTQEIAKKFRVCQSRVWITLRAAYKELKSMQCFQKFAADSGRTCYSNQ